MSDEKAESSIDYWQRRGHEPTAFEKMAIAGKYAVYEYRDRPEEMAGRVYDAVLAAAPNPQDQTKGQGKP